MERRCRVTSLAASCSGWGASAYFFFDLCSGLPLRLVEAIFLSSLSLIDCAICFDAPRSLLLGVLPSFADRAIPAACCWAFDLAGMPASPPGMPAQTHELRSGV